MPEAMLPMLQDLQRTSVLFFWHPKFPEHPLSGVGVVPTMTPRVGQLVSRLLRNFIRMGDDERDRPRKTAQGELNDGMLENILMIARAGKLRVAHTFYICVEGISTHGGTGFLCGMLAICGMKMWNGLSFPNVSTPAE